MKHSIVMSANMPVCTTPVHSREAVLSRIAKKAVGGKVCIVERASKRPMIVTMHPEGDAVTCETVGPDDEEQAEQAEQS